MLNKAEWLLVYVVLPSVVMLFVSLPLWVG